MGTRIVSQTINLSAPDQTSKYISADNSGLMVYDGRDGIQTPSNPSSTTNNVFIDENSLDIREGTNVLATFGADGAQIGKLSGAHSVIDADGQRFYASDGTTQLANIGYGEGQAQSGTAVAPYYTFGTRGNNSSVGNYSVAEGSAIVASGSNSHAEGSNTTASGHRSHAEGAFSVASGIESHAEGMFTTASGSRSHAEGENTNANGYVSHTEGYNTYANGHHSHAQNCGTIAQCLSQTALGRYNIIDTIGTASTKGNYVVIIGNGTDDDNRSNALTVDWNGNVTRGDGASYTAVQITRWS